MAEKAAPSLDEAGAFEMAEAGLDVSALSRQLAVYDFRSQLTLSRASVLISGLDALGVHETGDELMSLEGWACDAHVEHAFLGPPSAPPPCPQTTG